jgi:hypothetical protein
MPRTLAVAAPELIVEDVRHLFEFLVGKILE